MLVLGWSASFPLAPRGGGMWVGHCLCMRVRLAVAVFVSREEGRGTLILNKVDHSLYIVSQSQTILS